MGKNYETVSETKKGMRVTSLGAIFSVSVDT